MAAAIEQEFQTKPQLIEGRGGVFDVVVDGKLVFSKHQQGRFPEDDEVLAAMQKMSK